MTTTIPTSLRWVEREKMVFDEYGAPTGTEVVRVLQQRFQTTLPKSQYWGDRADGIIWSDWQDVPVEDEGAAA
jgi:hypothetical protein